MESRLLVLQINNHNGIKTSHVLGADGEIVFDREQALDVIAREMKRWINIFIEVLKITESRFWEMVRQGEIGYGENFIYAPIQKLGVELGVEFEMIELHKEVE